jgi:ABC-type amino acid transport substrate-binding protein
MVGVKYPTMERGIRRLRVGFDDPFRPLAWSEGGIARGPLPAVAAAVLAAAGHEWEFVPLRLEHSLAALAKGQVDALAFKAVVAQRHDIRFTQPLMTTAAALFGEAPSPATIATPRSGPLAGMLQKKFPQSALILTENYPDALAEVVAGRAQAAALNVHVGWHFAETLHPGRFARPQHLLEKLPLAMAVRKEVSQVSVERLNACIAQLHADGKLHALLEEHGVPAFAGTTG